MGDLGTGGARRRRVALPLGVLAVVAVVAATTAYGADGSAATGAAGAGAAASTAAGPAAAAGAAGTAAGAGRATAAGSAARAGVAASAGVSGDIDGDGYPDLVIGAPGGTVKGFAKAGYVAVAYGSKRGVDIDRHQGMTQAHAGVPGTPEAGDQYGSSLAVGDLDGDGYDDIVVGSAGEAIGDVKGAGSVTVVFGSKTGISDHAIAFHPAKPVARQGFGSRIAVGDWNHDGKDDLAVVEGAKVDVVYGAAGLRSTPSPKLTGITPPGGGIGTEGIAAGDVNGDGYADLVTVAYVDDPADEGTLGVLPGSAGGLTSTALGKSIGLPFAGYSTVVGDVNGDGVDDVVIDTGYSDGPDEYKLRTYPGGSAGLDGAHPADWGGAPQNGYATGLADLDGDGFCDLVLTDTSAADSDGYQGAGSLTVLRGSADWLTADGARDLSLDTPGVAGVAESGDLFGSAVAPADYNGDGYTDLAVGARGKYLGTGALGILYSDSTGVTAKNSILINPETFGYDPVKAGFGAALAPSGG